MRIVSALWGGWNTGKGCPHYECAQQPNSFPPLNEEEEEEESCGHLAVKSFFFFLQIVVMMFT
jgi:hypothetical protein